MLKSEGERLKKVVVCSPRKEYVRLEDPEEHNFIEVPDLERAKRQHEKLRSVLEGFGAEVVDVPELSGHPNSIFTRDTAVCTPRGYLRLSMGLPTRLGEEGWMAQVLDSLGEPKAGEIQPPGTLEGGDVILAGSVAFVGHSPRSNRQGVRMVSSMLREMGYEVRTWNVGEQFLHIGGAMSMVGKEMILCCRGVFPEGFFEGFHRIEVEGTAFSSVNVICLGCGEVVVHSAFQDTIDALREAGLTVHALDFSEILRGGGGPTCTILPVERQG